MQLPLIYKKIFFIFPKWVKRFICYIITKALEQTQYVDVYFVYMTTRKAFFVPSIVEMLPTDNISI